MNLDAMVAAALAGGREIMDVYARDFDVEFKEDASPLTEADERSHEVILRILTGADPETPLLSEEGAHAPYEERTIWDNYYLIDPLDGTKEFVKRNGEFTVNIAWVARDVGHGPDGDGDSNQGNGPNRGGVPPVPLDEAQRGVLPVRQHDVPRGDLPVRLHDAPPRDRKTAGVHSPIAGVVYAPFLEELYVGVLESEAWRIRRLPVNDPDVAEIVEAGATATFEQTSRLRLRAESLPVAEATADRRYTIVASRSHMTPETETFVDNRRRQHPNLNLISAGSSLKLCRVAEGSADEYPRFAPTMEWDTAAGDAVARAAGCVVSAWPGHERPATAGVSLPPLRYNKRELLNPWFLVRRVSIREAD